MGRICRGGQDERWPVHSVRIWDGRWTHVLVAHVFEEPQFSVGALGKQLGLEGPVQLLDCHLVTSAAVYCRAEGRTAWLENPPGYRQQPPALPAAPPGERSPHCTIGTGAHGLQVLVHDADLPGRFGHLLAVKALAGGWRGAHPRPEHRAPGPDPGSGAPPALPRSLRGRRAPRRPPASGAVPYGLFSWGRHPELPVTANSHPILVSGRQSGPSRPTDQPGPRALNT